MLFKRSANQEFKLEYNCFIRRLMPWKDVADSTWGSAWMKVKAGDATAAFTHSSHEIFIIIAGQGSVTIDNKITQVKMGDLVYVSLNAMRSIQNNSLKDHLQIISIRWMA